MKKFIFTPKTSTLYKKNLECFLYFPKVEISKKILYLPKTEILKNSFIYLSRKNIAYGCQPYFITFFSILNQPLLFIFWEMFILLAIIFSLFVFSTIPCWEKNVYVKKPMVKNDFRLFIKLLLSLFYVAYTTHKIMIFMNHLKITLNHFKDIVFKHF